MLLSARVVGTLQVATLLLNTLDISVLGVLGSDASSSSSSSSSTHRQPFRVAIIGAGIGGCSSAYYLKYPDSHGDNDGHIIEPSLSIDVTIYDTSAHGPGGRVQSRSFPIAGQDNNRVPNGDNEDQSNLDIDLGASIFIRDNQRVYNLSQHFNLTLTRKPMSDGRLPSTSGLWNGNEFIWKLDDRPWYDPSGWWQRLQLGWRYGFLQGFVDNFSQVYDSSMPKWRSIHELAERLNMTELLHRTAHDFLINEVGLNALFVEELVNAATRVNYGIDVDQIHALAGLVSLAPTVSDTMAIEGGNQLLVRELCNRSITKGYYGQRVVSLQQSVQINGAEECQRFVEQSKERVLNQANNQQHEQIPHGCRPSWIVTTEQGNRDTFDAIILAAPLDRAKFHNDSYSFDVAPVKYKQLYVTITRGHLNKGYFAIDESLDIPTSVMTHGGGDPHFISLTQMAVSPPLPYRANKAIESSTIDTDTSTPVLVKLFSNSQLEADVLSQLFHYHDAETARHKRFHSYPLMTPENARFDRRTEIAPGVWYVNGMEPFISTMETETVSAANIARFVRDWAIRVLHSRTSTNNNNNSNTTAMMTSYLIRVIIMPFISS
ncbi:Prenylcysteine lyase-domain-containing protein [Syncephalis plumigaleata]|nr:Prenylcysteine lyase-domain-containing protein [Syncephalis plumigaleata]